MFVWQKIISPVWQGIIMLTGKQRSIKISVIIIIYPSHCREFVARNIAVIRHSCTESFLFKPNIWKLFFLTGKQRDPQRTLGHLLCLRFRRVPVQRERKIKPEGVGQTVRQNDQDTGGASSFLLGVHHTVHTKRSVILCWLKF